MGIFPLKYDHSHLLLLLHHDSGYNVKTILHYCITIHAHSKITQANVTKAAIPPNSSNAAIILVTLLNNIKYIHYIPIPFIKKADIAVYH